jgi:WS/DGAT/MGAT family acyltransferase
MGEQLSMLDTMFLELEQVDESAHMHIGAALVFDPLPEGGTPGVDRFREHVRARLDALPRLSQRLSAPHAGPLTWLTWEPAELDVDAHVHHVVLPAPGGGAELRAWLADFWSHRLDRHRPLWEVTLLEGLEGGRWALATKTHHCLVDGVGALDIGNVLLDSTGDDAAPVRAPRAKQAEERVEHAAGPFWLSPGIVVRGARAGIGAALHPRASLERVLAAT